MKRLSIIIILAALLLNTGCKKFLAESSPDEVKPSSIQDLTQLMAGEGYPSSTSRLYLPLLNILTDDITCNGAQGQINYLPVVQKGKSPFTWSKDMFEDLLNVNLSSTTYVDSWEILYKKIGGCNVIIDYANKVPGDAVTRQNLMGQALAMRAYYYLLLVNLFGQPYNAPGVNPATSPGVPLKLTIDVTDVLQPRNSIAEVYNQIEADLKQGIGLMKANPQNNGIAKMNPLAAFTLLSRMYLYEEKWDLSIQYADSVIAQGPGLTQLSSFQGGNGGYYSYNNGSSFASNISNKIYDPLRSKEILWSYQLTSTNSIAPPESDFFSSGGVSYNGTTKKPVYAASNDLIALYGPTAQKDTNTYLGDLRGRIYINNYSVLTFNSPTDYYYTYYSFCGNTGGYAGIREAEAYLNRAEAKIQKFIAGGDASAKTEALSDINTLRISRYDPRQPYVNINISDGNQLLNFCRDERRREFAFDGQRWFDLRRYGLPAVTHVYYEDPSSIDSVTLTKGDSRYTLPIPKIVLQRNAALVPNP